MKLWLDDVRPKPPGFDLHCWSAEEAIQHIQTGLITGVSLDNDLGRKLEGYDVAKYIEQAAHSGYIPEMELLQVHSANPVARTKILQAFERAKRFWRP